MSHIPSSAMPHAHAETGSKPAAPAIPEPRSLTDAAIAIGATVALGAAAAIVVPMLTRDAKAAKKPAAKKPATAKKAAAKKPAGKRAAPKKAAAAKPKTDD